MPLVHLKCDLNANVFETDIIIMSWHFLSKLHCSIIQIPLLYLECAEDAQLLSNLAISIIIIIIITQQTLIMSTNVALVNISYS